MPSLPVFVFDTNVVIDWLVFDHPYLHDLRAAISDQRIEVVANELAREELTRVLSYPLLKLTLDRQTQIIQRYTAQTRTLPMPADFCRANLLLPQAFPHCRDRDDDVFLALAYHARAALVTRDRALLKLRKKVRRFEVTILEVAQLVAAVAALPGSAPDDQARV